MLKPLFRFTSQEFFTVLNLKLKANPETKPQVDLCNFSLHSKTKEILSSGSRVSREEMEKMDSFQIAQ